MTRHQFYRIIAVVAASIAVLAFIGSHVSAAEPRQPAPVIERDEPKPAVKPAPSPTIEAVNPIQRARAVEPPALNAGEFEFYTLGGYDGAVTWEVTSPTGGDIPVSLIECAPKAVVIGVRAGTTGFQSHVSPAVASIAVFGTGSGKAAIAAWGVSKDNRAYKVATLLVQSNMAPRPPPEPIPIPDVDETVVPVPTPATGLSGAAEKSGRDYLLGLSGLSSFIAERIADDTLKDYPAVFDAFHAESTQIRKSSMAGYEQPLTDLLKPGTAKFDKAASSKAFRDIATGFKKASGK